MASRIKAIGALRPRIELGKTAQKAELIRVLARATSLNEGSVDLVIKELRDQIIEFHRSGRAVKIEGLGTWTPNMALDGSLDVQYRADTALLSGLNTAGLFTGSVINRENIGKSGEQLVTLWNEQHPEDPVA